MGEPPAALGLTTATARAILADGPAGASRSEEVALRLGEAIRVGLLLDGERLPAEPALAEQFGVATVTLREALAALRAEGLVQTRRGRGGGSFVRTRRPLEDDALPPRLHELTTQDLRELGDLRCAVSGAAARLAAERALPDEVDGLRRQAERLRAAGTVSERRRADTQFTLEVAAAAQSARLTREELRLRTEIGDLLWLGHTEADHRSAVRSRLRLVDAIARRAGGRARELAEEHVAADTERLLRLRLTTAYPARAADVLAAVDEVVGSVLAALQPLAERYRELTGGALVSDDLAVMRPDIAALLAGHRDVVAGAGVVVAPGVLADRDRWLEWWWSGPSGAPQPLRVNLDPGAPDFFDYTTADWWTTPDRTTAPHVSGPYVDHACTGEYAVTLAVPVHRGDRLLGLAAADVPVARLERQVLPWLAALPEPAALVTAAGRVVASTSPRLAAGRLVPPMDPMVDTGPVTGWRLVTSA